MFAASFPAFARQGSLRALDSSRLASNSNLAASPTGATNLDASSQFFHANKWTPLGQALSRFHEGAHRFACEQRLELLSSSIERLRAMLLNGGNGVEDLLSRSFLGVSVVPDRANIVRQDSIFNVERMDWKTAMALAPKLGPAEFSTSLSRFLRDHSPLTLAQLTCLEISEVAAELSSSHQSKVLRSRVRFELAATRTAGAVLQGGITPPSPDLRWQAIGEWEIDWEPRESSAGGQGPRASEKSKNTPPASPAQTRNWQIVAWRPLEITTVQGPAVVFTDVTAAAFGQDPSFKSHLLRDTNYWRAVLDEASGIDIFGNCGVSVGDANGDGKDEIYLCQPQGLANRLYQQREPGVFKDVAGSAGVDLLDATSMALFADVLNRGRQDLILITQSRPMLFLNDGRGHFTLARDAFPSNSQQASLTSAALADYNHDGFLDLYVCSYGYFQGQGASPLPTPYYDARNGPPNYLYRNRGDGTFEDVTRQSGLNQNNNRFSFACAWNDFDDDGWPDLCVVNDFGRNNLYHNRRDGTFEDVSNQLAGYGSGMSAAFADLDADGAADIYVGNMWTAAGERVTAESKFQQRFADLERPEVRQFAMGNALYRRARSEPGVKRLEFSEVPGAAGAAKGRWAWCSDSFDLENDGWPDLYVVNGFLSSPESRSNSGVRPSITKAPVDAYLWEEIVTLSPHSNSSTSEYRAAWSAIFQLAHEGHPWNGNERNVFFLNTGHGEFVDASAAAGLDFIDDGRSFAVFDFDGDADLVLHSRTGPQLRLLRNDLVHDHASLAIRLTGKSGNRDAIGARVEVETTAGRQVRWLNCGSGFLTQHSKEMVFGLGAATEAGVVRVRWPRGAVSEYRNLKAGFRYFLSEAQSTQPFADEPLAAKSSRIMTAGISLSNEAPRIDEIPSQFSCTLVDPLELPPLAALDAITENFGNSHGLKRALLWLWAPNPTDTAVTQAFLEVQNVLPSRLVLWGDGQIGDPMSRGLRGTLWQADARFRQFWTTALTYLFDYRRELPMPTGLLIESVADSSVLLRSEDEAEERIPKSHFRLIKVYWGGADAKEIIRDAVGTITSGVEALPFRGTAVSCSFRRDSRLLGAALAANGLAAEAEIYLARAAKDSPGDPDAAYNLALVRRELGKIKSALSGVRAALSVRPTFPEAENLLGVLLSQSGDEAAAQKALEHATSSAPDFVEAWNNLGYVLLQRGDLEGARQALERAVSFGPNFPDAQNNLGIVSARLGDQQKAAGLFHRVLALEPENEQAANNLGVLYARQGKPELAVKIFQTLLQHNPEAASVFYNLARLDISLGKSSEARGLLGSWLARHPQDAIAQHLLEQAKAR